MQFLKIIPEILSPLRLFCFRVQAKTGRVAIGVEQTSIDTFFFLVAQ